jgi:hypothetical protein
MATLFVNFNAKSMSTIFMEIQTLFKQTNFSSQTYTNNLCNLYILTPKIPWDQKLVDFCLGNLREEK